MYKKGELESSFELMPSFTSWDTACEVSFDRMVIKGGASSEMISELHEQPFRILEIGAGNWLGNCGFLLDLKSKISNLRIGTDAIDWDVINQLSELKTLRIGGNFNAKLIFSSFKKLKALSTDWNKDYREDIFQLPSLEKLSLTAWRESDCTKLAKCEKLRHLELVDCRELLSLSGLERLKSLETLKIAGLNKLVDIQALQQAPNLKLLEVESCKKAKFSEHFGKDSKIRFLSIDRCGKMDSFEFLKGSSYLEYFFTGDTKSVSPEVSYIYELPNIFDVKISQARHYNSKTAFLEAELRAKHAENFDNEDETRRKIIYGDRDDY